MQLENLSDSELEELKQSLERKIARYDNLQLAKKVAL